jgi:Protein of unknown function (DUF4019)
MKRARTFYVVVVSILATSSCAAQDEHADAAAKAAALAWLSLVDAGSYAESWTAASMRFREAIPKAQWESKVALGRGSLGALKSRRLLTATFKSTLPGAPDGEYVVIRFESSFEHKEAAIETVTPMKDEHATWRVSGYYIK